MMAPLGTQAAHHRAPRTRSASVLPPIHALTADR
jgi:hypothetical protein